MITQKIDLNLIPGRVLPRVNVSQYDKGTRTLEFTIYNGDVSFDPTSYTAYIQGFKPDGHGFNYTATITSQKITADVTEQMTAVCGEVTCEVIIMDGTDRIGTGNFILNVERAAMPDDAQMSDSDYAYIEQLIEDAQQAVEDAQAAAEEAESWSEHAPYIGANGNWYVYDAQSKQFVDTGVQAEGPQGDEGPQGPAGPTGNGIASITKTGTSGLVDTYTITYTNGNTTTFTVTNGQNGTGSGDMTKAVYDQNNNGVVDDAEKLGGNLPAYYAKKTEVSALGTHKLGDFTTTSDVAISGVTYHTYWEVAPTASNQVYGVAVHPTNGKLTRIYNNKGTYTAVSYDANTTTGDGIKTKVAKTGTAQSAITDTISAGTTLDNAIGTLLNNDATLNADIHKGYVEVIGDGVKTRSQILDELYIIADKTKITEQSVLNFNLRVYHFMLNYSGTYFFGSFQCSSSNMQCHQCQMKSSGSIVEYVQSEVGGSTSYTNISTPVSASGRSYRLYY